MSAMKSGRVVRYEKAHLRDKGKVQWVRGPRQLTAVSVTLAMLRGTAKRKAEQLALSCHTA